VQKYNHLLKIKIKNHFFLEIMELSMNYLTLGLNWRGQDQDFSEEQ